MGRPSFFVKVGMDGGVAGGSGEAVRHSFLLARRSKREVALHARESGKARAGAGAGAVAVEQLPELCFRRVGSGEDQSMAESRDENPGSMNAHLYQERKGGPPSITLSALSRDT